MYGVLLVHSEFFFNFFSVFKILKIIFLNLNKILPPLKPLGR